MADAGDAAMAAMRANEVLLRAKLAEYRRYQQTPEYRAQEAERERQREKNHAAWVEFAALGWPVSRNLIVALNGRK